MRSELFGAFLLFFNGGFFEFFTTLFNTVSPVLPTNGDADQIRSANYEPDLNSRFFSCSGRVTFYAPNIRCVNKLAPYKKEGLV